MLFMERVITEKQITKPKQKVNNQVSHVKADLITLGGGIILAATIILTLVFVLTLIYPKGNGLQFVIIASLTLVSWGFLLNCSTESLSLENGYLQFKSFIGRTVRIELDKINSYKLTDLGVTLDGNMFLIEVAHEDDEKPVEIFLSPCWKKSDLKDFCGRLGLLLEEINS